MATTQTAFSSKASRYPRGSMATGDVDRSSTPHQSWRGASITMLPSPPPPSRHGAGHALCPLRSLVLNRYLFIAFPFSFTASFIIIIIFLCRFMSHLLSSFLGPDPFSPTHDLSPFLIQHYCPYPYTFTTTCNYCEDRLVHERWRRKTKNSWVVYLVHLLTPFTFHNTWAGTYL